MTYTDRPLIIIGGPTGVGKSDIAIKLAGRINGEIISADSVQVYRGLDIGSAKISPAEMQGVKHYLIDILNPDESFDVAAFKRYATEAINEIYAKGCIPIITGGTAFYIQALLYGVDLENEEKDLSYRRELESRIKSEEDEIELWKSLESMDPEYAAKTHYHNVKRVIRALEYIHNTGNKFSVYNAAQAGRKAEYNFAYFALNADRETVYRRINERVDKMMDLGLVKEVGDLLDKGYPSSLNSMSSIGYKEICDYLGGKMSLTESVDLIKQHSRNYAKRQLTWLRRERDVIFLDRDELRTDEEIIQYVLNILCEKDIIKYQQH